MDMTITEQRAQNQPWLRSASYDGLWILSPPFVATALVFVLLSLYPSLASESLSPLGWIVLVVGVDVSHVYASLYRTVLKREMWKKKRSLLILVPIIAYILAFTAYRWDPLIFWRILAYTAVFHFVRQPYGLMMLYKRTSKIESVWAHRLDQLAIYTASLYPLCLWHLDASRVFSWFVPGDFLIFKGEVEEFRSCLHITALTIAVAYGVKEFYQLRKGIALNIPKNLVLLGTALSFGMGIAVWNSDFAFTATNVISHGVAYMGLIWLTDAGSIFNRREESRARSPLSFMGPILFLLTLLSLAFLEEGLWDALVWNEHSNFFGVFNALFSSAKDETLAWLVPLLALPQATHYLWDGFIWRRQPMHQSKEKANI